MCEEKTENQAFEDFKYLEKQTIYISVLFYLMHTKVEKCLSSFSKQSLYVRNFSFNFSFPFPVSISTVSNCPFRSVSRVDNLLSKSLKYAFSGIEPSL